MLLLFYAEFNYSQEFLKPAIKFTNACASNSFNNYESVVVYHSAVFNSDNVFVLEMSDEYGDFENPVALKTISNQNNTFKFTVNFSIPENIVGGNYKLRVKSSSPQKTSPESDFFEAYYMTSENLILNNFENVTLCSNENKEISVNSKIDRTYQWYKNGEKFALTNGNIQVNEPGSYYCEIYYGSCTSNATSNIIEVKQLENLEVSILGESNVLVCQDQTYSLEASIDNDLYSYTWYKNNEKLEGLPDYSPKLLIENPSQFGDYYVEVKSGNGCASISNLVSINASNQDFEIVTNSETTDFILYNETKILSVSHTAENAFIQWYRNNQKITNSNSKSIEINENGNYYAMVTEQLNGCELSKKSDDFNIYNVQQIEPSIDASTEYNSCSSNQVTLSIASVKVKDTQGNLYNLSNNHLDLIAYKWFLDDKEIQDQHHKELVVNNFNNNGVYNVKVIANTVVGISNSLDINVKIPTPIIQSNKSNLTLCNEDDSIRLFTDDLLDVNYQWFYNDVLIEGENKNELEVSSPGEYTVKLNAFNCESISEIITVKNIDLEFEINANSNQEDYILTNETKTLFVSHTGENVEIVWYKNNIKIPDTNVSEISINDAGIYFAELTNYKDGCSKTITSPKFKINAIKAITPTIENTPNYSDCSLAESVLKLSDIKVLDTENNSYILSQNQYEYLNFSWINNGAEIDANSIESLQILDYENNGSYQLNIDNGPITGISNALEIKLKLPELTIEASNEYLSLCNDNSINLKVDEIDGIEYQWYLNGEIMSNEIYTVLSVDKPGYYSIKASGFNCESFSEDIQINDFDASLISFDFDQEIVLEDGETEELNVFGADEYSWIYKGEEISNDSFLKITEEGSYKVIAYLEGCKVEKSFEVEINVVTKVIPNTLTPNGDGINDFWKIPAEYAFKNDIEIEIFNANGKNVLKENNYQNNWPRNIQINQNQLFYYIIKKENNVIQKGTITVLN